MKFPMFQDLLHCIHKATPITDKILGAAGVGAVGMITIGHVQAGVGILVGVLTAAALIPRVILGWRDFARTWKTGEAASEDEGE